MIKTALRNSKLKSIMFLVIFCYLYKRFPKLIQGIEDITWLHGDKKFLFEC